MRRGSGPDVFRIHCEPYPYDEAKLFKNKMKIRGWASDLTDPQFADILPHFM